MALPLADASSALSGESSALSDADQCHESGILNAVHRQDVQTFHYKGLVIVLPEEFSSNSQMLVENQKSAIDRHVICNVTTATKVYIAGWTSKCPALACVHLNLPPMGREKLDLPRMYPLTLVERDSLIVGGVFLMSKTVCFTLRQDSRCIELFDLEYDAMLKKLRCDQLTYRPLPLNTNHLCANVLNDSTPSELDPPTALTPTLGTKRRRSTGWTEPPATPLSQWPFWIENGEDASIPSESQEPKRQCTDLDPICSPVFDTEQLYGVVTNAHFLGSHFDSPVPQFAESVPTQLQFPPMPIPPMPIPPMPIPPMPIPPMPNYTPALSAGEVQSTGYTTSTSATTTPTAFQIGDPDKLKQSIRNHFTHFRHRTMQSIITLWVKELEPNRRKKYGHFNDQYPAKNSAYTFPPWWPGEVRYTEISRLNLDDVIIVAAHLLLHFRDEVMDGVNHEEHWTADLREIVFEKPPMSENRRPGFPQKMLAPLGMSETYFSL